MCTKWSYHLGGAQEHAHLCVCLNQSPICGGIRSHRPSTDLSTTPMTNRSDPMPVVVLATYLRVRHRPRAPVHGAWHGALALLDGRGDVPPHTLAVVPVPLRAGEALCARARCGWSSEDDVACRSRPTHARTIVVPGAAPASDSRQMGQASACGCGCGGCGGDGGGAAAML